MEQPSFSLIPTRCAFILHDARHDVWQHVWHNVLHLNDGNAQRLYDAQLFHDFLQHDFNGLICGVLQLLRYDVLLLNDVRVSKA